MTNEQKAREIGSNWRNAKCCGVPMDSDIVAEHAALEMAQWKDQHPRKGLWNSEKVIEWLNDWFTDNICNCPIPITKAAREAFFNDLRKAMEEE